MEKFIRYRVLCVPLRSPVKPGLICLGSAVRESLSIGYRFSEFAVAQLAIEWWSGLTPSRYATLASRLAA